MKQHSEKIILTGNCYWCTEALYQQTKGCRVVPGYYSIAHLPFAFTPKDRLEAVALTFDNTQISFRDVLSVFFISHNPTLVSWNKADCVSPLNRSSIIVATEDLQKIAASYLDSQRPLYSEPLHTKILLGTDQYFTPAPLKEHSFYLNNLKDGYSTSVIEPRLQKLKTQAPHLIKK